MSYWQVVIPAAAQNRITNPSFERDLTGWVAYATGTAAGTRSRVTANARYGYYCYYLQKTGGGATDQWGAYHNADTPGDFAQNDVVAFSIHLNVPSGTTAKLYLSINAGAQTASTTITGPYDDRASLTVTITLGVAITSIAAYVYIDSSTGSLYMDGAQIEADVVTDYMDGDQPGCYWNGQYHYSTSRRPASSPDGGRAVDLADYAFYPTQIQGIGVPPHLTIMDNRALSDGGLYRRTRIEARRFSVLGTLIGSSRADVHTKRKALFDLFNQDAVDHQRPFELRYSGSGETFRLKAVYEDGLGFGILSGFSEDIGLRFVAPEPFWYPDQRQVVDAALNQSVSNANYILRRTRGVWQSLGTGGDSGITQALALAANGDVFAGGTFTLMGGVANTVRIARWDESAWSALGTGLNGPVQALAFAPNGILYAGGGFLNAGGHANADYIAQWSIAAYTERVRTIRTANLIWHGRLNEAGGTVVRDSSTYARHGSASGVTWGADGIGDGFKAASFDGVNDVIDIYSAGLAGAFNGGQGTIIIWAKANAAAWTDGVEEFAIRLAADANNVVAIRINSTNLLQWFYNANGTTVNRTKVTTTTDWMCLALTWDASGGVVKAYFNGIQEGADLTGLGVWAGSLAPTTTVIGASSTSGASSWDGSLAHAALFSVVLSPDDIAVLSGWAPVGGAPIAGANYVNTLAAGPDDKVYAGGTFDSIGGVAANRIAYWDRTTWNTMGTGFNGFAYAIAVAPNGDVYVGGSFTTAGGVTVNNIARWDGSAWSALGSGCNDWVYALAFGPDGMLYLGGVFTTAGGVTVNHVARWNGVAFEALGGGVNGNVRTLFWHGTLLYAAGSFVTAGGLTLPDKAAVWNGSAWAHLDFDLPGSATIYAAIVRQDDELIIGYNTGGTAVTSVITTVTNTGNRRAAPVLRIHRSGGTSLALYWLENLETGARLYLNYSLEDGEELIIDCRPDSRGARSSFWGPVNNAVLRQSDFAGFELLKGENRIGIFALAVNTPTVEATLAWQPVYYAGDGS